MPNKICVVMLPGNDDFVSLTMTGDLIEPADVNPDNLDGILRFHTYAASPRERGNVTVEDYFFIMFQAMPETILVSDLRRRWAGDVVADLT